MVAYLFHARPSYWRPVPPTEFPALEHKTAGVTGMAPSVRRHPPGTAAAVPPGYVGHEGAAVVDGLAVAEDEVDAALHEAAAEVETTAAV